MIQLRQLRHFGFGLFVNNNCLNCLKCLTEKNTPFIMPEFDSDTPKSLVVLIYS